MSCLVYDTKTASTDFFELFKVVSIARRFFYMNNIISSRSIIITLIIIDGLKIYVAGKVACIRMVAILLGSLYSLCFCSRRLSCILRVVFMVLFLLFGKRLTPSLFFIKLLMKIFLKVFNSDFGLSALLLNLLLSLFLLALLLFSHLLLDNFSSALVS